MRSDSQVDARALREIYLAAGEMPTSRGYPPGALAEGCDIAIHTGPVPADDLIGQRAYDYLRVLCAAPAYLAAHGEPHRRNLTASQPVVRWRLPDGGRLAGASLEDALCPGDGLRQGDRVLPGEAGGAQPLLGLEAGDALPHPLLALGLAQRVQVEQRRPGCDGDLPCLAVDRQGDADGVRSMGGAAFDEHGGIRGLRGA